MNKIWFVIIIWISKILYIFSKVFNKNICIGKFACKMQKNFIRYFSNIDYNNVIVITGTNGKSLTSTITLNILNQSGKTVISNIDENNNISGIASAFIKKCGFFGRIKCDFILLDVNENIIEEFYDLIAFKNLCVTNIQSDYIRSNGNILYRFNNIRNIIDDGMTLYINNDDPNSKLLGEELDKTIYFGVSKNEHSYIQKDLFDVSVSCPKCGNKIIFNYNNTNNMGNFRCSNCDYKSESNPTHQIVRIDYDNNEIVCNKDKYSVSNIEPIYLYSYACSISICRNFGITKKQIEEGFNILENNILNVKVRDKNIKYIQIKHESAESFKFAMDYISEDKNNKVVVIGIDTHKYINTFVMYDSNLSNILNTNIEKCICFTKDVCYDIANILSYAGLPKDKILVLNTDSYISVFREINKLNVDNIYLVSCNHKYDELKRYASSIEKDDNNEK